MFSWCTHVKYFHVLRFVHGNPLLCRKLVFMAQKECKIFLLLMVMCLIPGFVAAQAWNFVKDKDGIKIYTRKEPGNTIKSFMGITDIYAPMDKVCNLIGNVKNLDWWDKNLKEIRVLQYEKNKRAQYYLVYNAPWPITDRDLCVDAVINDDPVTGVRTIVATPLLNVIPKRPDCVRIEHYWQSWTLQPTGKGYVHAILEGYVDPAGSVPDWIYNMVITDTPYKVMLGAKKQLEAE